MSHCPPAFLVQEKKKNAMWAIRAQNLIILVAAIFFTSLQRPLLWAVIRIRVSPLYSSTNTYPLWACIGKIRAFVRSSSSFRVSPPLLK